MNKNPGPTGVKTESKSSLSSVAKSLLATGVLLCAVMAGAYISGTSTSSNLSEYNTTQSQYSAISGRIQLTMVEDRDIPAAIASMQLSPADQQALQASLDQAAHSLDMAANSASSQEITMLPQADGSVIVRKTSEALSAKDKGTRLAWLTLWDISADSGDVISVESQGYSRMITLTKEPVRVAIPYSVDGTIKFTGVFAEAGNGITYGSVGWHAAETFVGVPPHKLTIRVNEGQVLNEKLKVN